jgi:hypothetical protein
MSRFAALGIATVLSLATAASALTFTPTTDNRRTYVGTDIFDGSFTDMDEQVPAPPFSVFDSDITAGSDYDGVFADAFAGQFSELGSMYIHGSGSASAQIGVVFDNWVNDDKDAEVNGVMQGMTSDEVGAGGRSLLEIIFSIDMDAQFDLSGAISAGVTSAQGDIVYGSDQSVSVVLFDIDGGVALVDESVTDGGMSLSTSGQLSPGNYRFTVSANVDVFGGQASEADTNGHGVPQGNIYSASASYKSVSLALSGGDKPIPEPLTTTLAGIGLGALVLQTTRRRRA